MPWAHTHQTLLISFFSHHSKASLAMGEHSCNNSAAVFWHGQQPCHSQARPCGSGSVSQTSHIAVLDTLLADLYQTLEIKLPLCVHHAMHRCILCSPVACSAWNAFWIPVSWQILAGSRALSPAWHFDWQQHQTIMKARVESSASFASNQ